MRHISPIFHNIRSTTTPRYAAFSTSRISKEKEGQVDQELSAKLQSELDMERETRDSQNLPPSLADYLENSSFKLHDTAGQEEVHLTRKFGDETVRVSFSIADLNDMDPESDPYDDDDKALYDEPTHPDDIPENAQSGGANAKGTSVQGRTAGGNMKVGNSESNSASDPLAIPEDEEDDEDDGSEAEPSFPARIDVKIEKAGKGILQIETTAQDGEIVIDNVTYYANGELADAKTAEIDYKRRNLYAGPPFGNLDEDLQVLLERYLDERGINTALALWVPEYIDFKEQREYLGWLDNVKSFVDA